MQAEIDRLYKKIGDNVYRFRVLGHLTQDDLATRSGLSSPYVSQIERADLHKGITCTALMRFATCLKVPVCVLLAEEPCVKYMECLNRMVSGFTNE